MQSVPNRSSLAWVGHGHHQMMLWTLITSFTLSEDTEESWKGYLTTSSPHCKGWSSNRIHLACPKKWCRHCLILHIGMPHPVAPSAGCLVERILHMSYQYFHGKFGHARGFIPHLHMVINRIAQEEEGNMAYSSFADWIVWDPYLEGCVCWGWGIEEVWVQHQEFQSIWPTLHMQELLCEGVLPMDPANEEEGGQVQVQEFS